MEKRDSRTGANRFHSVSIPYFLPDEPDLWFHQVEAYFMLKNIISDEEKFCYVISQLECKYAQLASNVIRKPPKEEKYETLKRTLIRKLNDSKSFRIIQWTRREELGGRTPSELLRDMQRYADDRLSENLLRVLWQNHLSVTTRAVVSEIDLPLEKLAEVADLIHDSSPQVSTDIVELSRNVEDLKRLVSKCVSRSQGKLQNRQTQRQVSRRRSSPARNDHCWYHQVFDARATKCRSPCSYASHTATSQKRYRQTVSFFFLF